MFLLFCEILMLIIFALFVIFITVGLQEMVEGCQSYRYVWLFETIALAESTICGSQDPRQSRTGCCIVVSIINKWSDRGKALLCFLLLSLDNLLLGY